MSKQFYPNYRGPIPPDPNRPCHCCKHRRYDGEYDETSCINPKCVPHFFLIDENGTCDYWEKWEDK